MWLCLGIGFILFFYHYNNYHHLGVTLNQKSFKLAYDDMEKHARRISVAFLMYLATTYILLVIITESFLDCAVKGALVCGVLLPIINSHYS